MTLRVGETGKIFRVAAGFDMSSFTELTVTFNKPDGTTVTKTQTGGEIALGAGVTDPDLGVLAANEYVDYDIEVGFLNTLGDGTGCLTYTNTVPTPDDVFIGNTFTYTVVSAC